MKNLFDDIMPAGAETVDEIAGIPVSEEMSLIISILFTLAVSGVMAFTYRISHDPVTYNRKFNIMLIMLAFISTVLLILVGGNSLISIGALGALSICRIRMNTKDPRDLGFVFWSLSIGIASATCSYLIGAVCSAALFVILAIAGRLGRPGGSSLIVIRGEREHFERVQDVLLKNRRIKVQSENISENDFELVYELNMKDGEQQEIIRQIYEMEGISRVNILAPKTKVA